jgi:hypothetical protein
MSETAAALIRADLAPILTTLYVVYGVAGLAVTRVPTYPPLRLVYAPRTWTDLHLEQLGWGLVGSVYALIAAMIWLAFGG